MLFLVLIAGAASAAIAALFGPGGLDDGTAGCAITGASTTGVSGYSPEQSLNAAIIVAVGKQMDVPEYGRVIALAAALQESGLRNLDHGDRDSLGLFQQRPSQGWGTPAQITNPAYAATAFYRHLLALPDWQRMSLNDAAQTVQRSATPTAYGHHEPAARALTAALGGATCTPAPAPAPGPAGAQAIAFAHAQIGDSRTCGSTATPFRLRRYAVSGVQIPRTPPSSNPSKSPTPDRLPETNPSPVPRSIAA